MYIGRLDQEVVPYALNLLANVDWTKAPHPWLKRLFIPKQSAESLEQKLSGKSPEDLDEMMHFCITYHANDELFWTFKVIIKTLPLIAGVKTWIERHPPLVFVLLKSYPPDDSHILSQNVVGLEHTIVKSIVRFI